MLTLLHTFITVYEKQSFSKAASLLFISQPTVSTHITRLETLIETPLFIRYNKKRIEPTEFGTFLYNRSSQLIKDWDSTLSDIQQQKKKRKQFTIFISQSISEGYFNDFIPNLINNFPDFDFDFQIKNSESIITEVLQNTHIIGLVEKPVQYKELTEVTLLEDEMVRVGSTTAPYWLLREPKSGVRYYQEIYIQQYNIRLNNISTNNLSFIFKLLKNNIGQTLISKKALKHLPDIEWNATPLSRKLVLIRNNMNDLDPDTDKIITLISGEFKKLN